METDIQCYRCSAWPCTCKDGQTIICGDCREVLPELEPVDLVLTDPPYGLADRWTGGTWGAQAMYADARRWDREPVTARDIAALLEKATHAIVWGGNYIEGMPACRGLLAWSKTPRLETMADFELAWTNLDRPAKSLSMPRNREYREHPTQKPIRLMQWCIEQIKNCESVLDPFLGSGTTLRACKDLGRRGIGIEIEERYCEIAANRLRQEVLF